jgi:translation initiation factor IF-1
MEKYEFDDEVTVIGSEYGTVLEVLENDHYLVDVENRGKRKLHASHMQATGRKRSDYE